jgi:hypothetical protein
MVAFYILKINAYLSECSANYSKYSKEMETSQCP